MVYYSVALLVLGFAALAACGPFERNDNHNIYDCVGTPGKMEYRGRHSKDGKLLQYVSESVFIPQTGALSKNIVCIYVLDQQTNGRGGYPKIVNGGNGHKFVQIQLQSQFSRGYDFVIEVYTA